MRPAGNLYSQRAPVAEIGRRSGTGGGRAAASATDP